LFLPAIATVAAISAIATPPATATMASTPTSPAAPPAAVPTAPATAAFRLGTCLIHHQVSPAKILPVQGIDRTFRIFVCVHFHEGEAARLARETVTNEIDCRRGYSDLRKPLLKLLFRRRKRKISDIELLHLVLLLSGT
jgi:hypothetical protein